LVGILNKMALVFVALESFCSGKMRADTYFQLGITARIFLSAEAKGATAPEPNYFQRHPKNNSS